MKDPIYLDYNATTPVDPEVADALWPYIQRHYGNPSSSYTIGQSNKEAINLAREQVAAILKAKPEEIIFTGSATESNNLAIRGAALANQDKGRHIITSVIEHPAVLEVCSYLATMGFEITHIPIDKNGIVDPQDIENAVRPDTILISIMHANNEVGSIQPITEISAIARKYGITFHSDAAQSVGKIETNTESLGVALMTVAGHKLYAPKGIGALYIKEGIKINKLLYGARQEKGLRPGTENVAFIVALGKACEIALRDFDQNVRTMLSAKEHLHNSLKTRLGNSVILNGRPEKTLPNTLSVAFPGVDGHRLTNSLSSLLMISTGSACHANTVEVSSVLKAMRLEHSIASGTIRISTGKFTSFTEIDQSVEILCDFVNKYSK